MGQVLIYDHPLIQHKIAMLRDKNTSTKDFRELVSEIAMLMCYEVTRNLPLRDVDVETPIGIAHEKMLAGKNICFVPVLRAGLGMVDGVLSLVPSARVGHIGLYRDPETLEPVEYYCKLPVDVAEREVVVLDPMLATGGSASAAISFIKQRGLKESTELLRIILTLIFTVQQLTRNLILMPTLFPASAMQETVCLAQNKIYDRRQR